MPTALLRLVALAVLCCALLATGADAATWKKVGKVNRPSGVNALSCPAANLCVAAGYSSVSVTSNPAGPAGSWKRQVIDTTKDPNGNPSGIGAVGCVSATACVAGDDSQNGFFSASPLSGPWSGFRFPSDTYVTIKAIGCSPQGNCTALGVDGHALSTSTLTATSVWNFIQLPGTTSSNYNTDLSSVSCPSTTCVLAQSGSSVYVTTDAGATWSAVKIPGASRVASLDCVSASFCIAGAGAGGKAHVWISRDPGSSSSWKPVKTFGKRSDVTAVACASTRRCFVADGGKVYSSSKPSTASSWKLDKTRNVWKGVLSMIDCPSAKVCVGSDQFGDIGVARL